MYSVNMAENQTLARNDCEWSAFWCMNIGCHWLSLNNNCMCDPNNRGFICVAAVFAIKEKQAVNLFDVWAKVWCYFADM